MLYRVAGLVDSMKCSSEEHNLEWKFRLKTSNPQLGHEKAHEY